MNLYIFKLNALLEAVAELTGTGCVWKISRNGRPEIRLPWPVRIHDAPFCRMIKSRCGALSRCKLNDAKELSLLAEKFPAEFGHCCHAGAFEFAIPIRNRFGWILGMVLCGPFRPPASTDARFDGLPEWRPEQGKPLATLVEHAFRPVVEQLYDTTGDAVRDLRITRAIEYVRNHLDRPIPIREVAALCFLSSSRFSHVFRRECGIDFTAFVLKLRLELACNLLANTDLSIGEIASSSGFCNQSHFGAIFRREKGLSPAAYRRANTIDDI